jgi:hypothetical protein
MHLSVSDILLFVSHLAPVRERHSPICRHYLAVILNAVKNLLVEQRSIQAVLLTILGDATTA